MIAKRLTGNSLYAVRKRFFRENPLCMHCKPRGVTTLAAELDHIVPLWAGGRNEWSNYQSLCIPCHMAKSLEEQGKSQTTKPIAPYEHKPKPQIGLDGWPVREG